MSSRTSERSTPALLGIAVILGLLIAAIDNFAFGGEVSPVVVLIGAGCGVLPSRREA